MDRKLKQQKKLRNELAQAEGWISSMGDDIERFDADIKDCEERLKKPGGSQWTKDDDKKLEDAKKKVNNAKKSLEMAEKAKKDLAKKRDNLNQQIDLCNKNVADMADELAQMSDPSDELTDAQERLEAAEAKVAESVKQAASVTQRKEQATLDLRAVTETIGVKEEEETKLARVVERFDEFEREQRKKIGDLETLKEKSQAELREFPSKPVDIHLYENVSKNKLMKEMAQVNRKLDDIGPVNQKAIDQYESFMEDQGKLQQQLEEANTSARHIKEIMDRMDQWKEQALIKALESINKHFGACFSELVRGGKGRLTPIKNADGIVSEVKMEVSFSGQNQSFLLLQQLSGGQKTVVALTLLFAMQRHDPAPFYLFDEIDAALDNQYRTSVANLIHKESKRAQIIMTTFRPELLQKSEKFYRVSQANRQSVVRCVDRKAALKVIEQQQEVDKVEQ